MSAQGLPLSKMTNQNIQTVSPNKLMLVLAAISIPLVLLSAVMFFFGFTSIAAIALLAASLPGGLLLFSFLSFMEDNLT